MRRLSLWLKAHPAVGDTLIAASVALIDLSSGVGQLDGQMSSGDYFIVGLMLIGPLVIRRHHPVLTAYLILLGGYLQLFTHGDIHTGIPMRLGDLALAIALYTLVVYTNRRTALVYVGWLAIGTAAWMAWRVAAVIRPDELIDAVFLTFFVMLIFTVSWTIGEFIGARRAYHAEVERRLRMLEFERDQQARIAVVEERTRIARELHDVVAHAVSVMVVQADGAKYALAHKPDLADCALDNISETGRQALAELRRLLGVLRDAEEGAERAPQPGTGQLTHLADKVRSVGLPIKLELRGDLDHLPTAVGLGVYRIIQEALTNTLKHAGPGASAEVRVLRDDGQVEIEVLDNGHGVPSGLATGGNGLIGMKERASVFGGSLEAGPRPGGGWRVKALLPLAIAE